MYLTLQFFRRQFDKFVKIFVEDLHHEIHLEAANGRCRFKFFIEDPASQSSMGFLDPKILKLDGLVRRNIITNSSAVAYI